MNLSEADYIKVIKYIASTIHRKVVRHNGVIGIVPLSVTVPFNVNAYTMYPTAKEFFKRHHAFAPKALRYNVGDDWGAKLFARPIDVLRVEADLMEL